MLSIWEHFAAYVNLQLQIKRMNVPTRPLKGAQLQALFGVTANEKKTSSKSSKGKKKGKKNAPEPEEEEEEDDDDQGDADSLGEDGTAEDAMIDTDKVDETGPSTREERAKNREEQDMRKKELNTLFNDLTQILKASSKFKNDSTRPDQLDPHTNWADINGPWIRASKLTGTAYQASRFPGKQTFKFHTAEYGAISHSSYYRYMPTLAAMILAEASAVVGYRVELVLYQPEGGAAFIRSTIEEIARDYLHPKKPKEQVLVQKMLPTTKARSAMTTKAHLLDSTEPPPKTLTWPDGIYNPQYASQEFDLESEMTEYWRDVKLGHQERSVQSAVDAIVSNPCAWENKTGALTARDKPALHKDVVRCLDELTVVSTFVSMYSVCTLFLHANNDAYSS